MVDETKEPIGYALLIFVAFVALVAAANVLLGAPPAAAVGGHAVMGNALLFVGAVTVVGMALPLWLAARGRLALPVWPAPGTGDNALAVLLVVFLFARVETVAAIFAEGRPGGSALATFLGAAALNLASVTATVGVLLPALKRRMPVAPATIIAALAFSLYHVAQYNTFAGALDPKALFVLAVFGLGYSLYYFWSRSLLLTATLQHLVTTTNLIYGRDFEFGEAGWPFHYSLVVLVAFLIFVIAKRRLYAAERFTHF
jgi:membrane protease YdiL (CAAX protease family)